MARPSEPRPSARRTRPAGHPLLIAIRRELERQADPARAAPMRAYMKSAMPFYGVPTPAFRRICRRAIDQHPLQSAAEWRRAVEAIWAGATHREERHAAIEVAGTRRYRAFETPTVAPLYRRMIRSGAWWDYVDSLAKRMSSLLARYPARIKPLLLTWARDRSLWIRRVAIIAQVGFRQHTDPRLLFAAIEPSLESREFFLRKAIGWALREHAKADPEAVRRYLVRCGDRLSPLSRREAAKGFTFVRRHGLRRRSRSPSEAP